MRMWTWPITPSASMDYVILGHTLQRMEHPDKTLRELARIGKHVIISVPNFAFWYNRLYLLMMGRMPISKNLPFEWYETLNIHFCSLTDMVRLSETLGISIEKTVTHKAWQEHSPARISSRIFSGSRACSCCVASIPILINNYFWSKLSAGCGVAA